MAKVQFGSLYPTTLGFDRMFNDLESMLNSTINHTAEKFPPHNIIKLDEYKYSVELAVAGFDEDEIDITVEDGLLTIKGEKKPNDETVNYLHKGIGTRSFSKQIHIIDTVEVRGAVYKNGILSIGLENVIPDSKKPRKVEIEKDLNFFKSELLTED